MTTGPCGQTDMTNPIVTFHTFANAPKYATFPLFLYIYIYPYSKQHTSLILSLLKPQTYSNRINVHNEVYRDVTLSIRMHGEVRKHS